MMFHVGQKVVCINASPGPFWPGSTFLREKAVYTVAEAVGPDADGDAGVALIEVWHPSGYFKACRFRPLAYPRQSLEHDVAQFKGAARHARAPEGADA